MFESVIGIDPGVQGGIAIISGSELVLADRTPRVKLGSKWEYDTTEMAKIIRSVLDLKPKMFVEKVHSMPRDGSKQAFSFGKGFGVWIGIASAFEIPIEFILPTMWKKRILEGTDKSKGAAILKAKQIFPHIDLKPGRMVKDHDGIADAVCIAVCGGMRVWK